VYLPKTIRIFKSDFDEEVYSLVQTLPVDGEKVVRADIAIIHRERGG